MFKQLYGRVGENENFSKGGGQSEYIYVCDVGVVEEKPGRAKVTIKLDTCVSIRSGLPPPEKRKAAYCSI